MIVIISPYKKTSIPEPSCSPSTIDFILHYANRNGYHYWNKIVSPEFKNSEVRGAFERKTAKIYRKTYSNHSSIKPGTTEYIPEFFKDPFHLDVSSEYLYTTDVSIHIPKKLENSPHYAYLCVFNNLTWNPIAIGGNHLFHRQIQRYGEKTSYIFPLITAEKTHPINYPFIFNSRGEIKHLVPDTNNLQKLVLTRKYPSNSNLYYYISALTKLSVEAANQPSFQNPTPSFRSLSSMGAYCEGKINTDKKYRYWRISHPHSLVCRIILSRFTRRTRPGSSRLIFYAAFDGDPLTNINRYDKKNFVIDFNTPRQPIQNHLSSPK